MALINRGLTEQTPALGKVEWDLRPDMLKNIPEFQWLTMLNYEYARCCDPIIQAVNLLRKPESNTNGNEKRLPMFARYLARHYPEFPNIPWAQIAAENWVERLGLFDITEETKFYFTDPAWQTWELFDIEARTLPETLTDLAAESYGVFKIDFSQKKEVIAKQFHAWLEQRLREASRRSKELKPGKKRGHPVGRAHKKRKCQDYLKALGGLRALKYWGNVEEAEICTSALYGDSHSWKRAENLADEMFARLSEAWTFAPTPFDPFEACEAFDDPSILPPQSLRNPLPVSYKKPESKKRLAQVKKTVQDNFVVTYLKTESI